MLTASLLLLAAFQAAPIAEKDAADLGRALEQAVAKDGPGVYCRMMNLDAFYERVKGTTQLSAAMNQLLRSMLEPVFLPEAVFSTTGTDLTMTFLRVRTVGQEFRPIFRILGKNGVITYHELVLGGDSRAITVVDFKIHTFGECYSDVVRRLYIPTGNDLKVLNNLRGPMAGDLASSAQRKPMVKLLETAREGTPREVLKRFDQLEDLKRVRPAHVVRLASAIKIDAATFESALGDMLVAFPDETAAYLPAITAYYSFKKFDKALGAIDKVDAQVGGDPYLDALRAMMFIGTGDLPKALAAATSFVKAEPHHENSWWMLVDVHLAMKDFQAVVADFGDIEKRLKTGVPDPAGDPRYAEFIKSPEYADWLKTRPAK